MKKRASLKNQQHSCRMLGYNAARRMGGIAQLGERLHGMQEVSGSIPLTSTIISGINSQDQAQQRLRIL